MLADFETVFALLVLGTSSVLFAHAAASKIATFQSFVVTVRTIITVAPARAPLMRAFSLVLITAEVLVPLLFLVSLHGARGLIITQLILYSFVGVYILVTRQVVECNCFGDTGAIIGKWTVFRNLLWIAILATVDEPATLAGERVLWLLMAGAVGLAVFNAMSFTQVSDELKAR